MLETARQDTGLLRSNDRKGDRFSTARPVDFLLLARDREKAKLVASFMDDCRYGQVHVEQAGGELRVRVVIEMPATQNVLCAVSGLMALRRRALRRRLRRLGLRAADEPGRAGLEVREASVRPEPVD